MPTLTSAPIDHLLEELWSVRGSDLLLSAGSPPLIRVDGVFRRLAGPALDAEDVASLVTAVLGARFTEALHRDKQVDFALTWRDQARLRGNAFLQRGTLALALRAIPVQIPTLADLGVPEVVGSWLGLPKGFILVTGPTGSGKSTTLAAMIDWINRNRALHILTIEDPIEYVHTHNVAAVNQREVGTDTDSFADALRAALREDPDVILIGEMRDPQSVAAALTMAETGHLVFASLHTNDSAQTLDRIIDVFPAEQQPQIRLQLAHTLVGVLAQHLLPRRGGGRVGAYEVLVGTNGVRNMIREGKTRQLRNLVATGQRAGMQTLESALTDLIARGVVDYDEAILWTTHEAEVSRPPPPVAPVGVTATGR